MLTDVLLTVIQFAAAIFSFLFAARFAIQAARANFYNPICQGIIKVTDIFLKPLRLILRPIGNLDLASVGGMVLVAVGQSFAFRSIADVAMPDPLTFATIAAAAVVRDVTTLYIAALFVRVIASWIAPDSPHPGMQLVLQITEPLAAPLRRLIPPVGGLDLSIMVLMLILFLINNTLLRPIPPF